MIPLTLGISAFLAGRAGGRIHHTSFPCGWWRWASPGSTWGGRNLRSSPFPLFSLAMFVPPNAIYAPIPEAETDLLQIGVRMLQLWGMSAYREGNVIDLGFTQLQVVDACSGLRYVTPLFILGCCWPTTSRPPCGRGSSWSSPPSPSPSSPTACASPRWGSSTSSWAGRCGRFLPRILRLVHLHGVPRLSPPGDVGT